MNQSLYKLDPKEQQRKRRERNYALGLTWDGQPRRRNQPISLAGMTEEEKFSRAHQQKLSWQRKNRI